MQPKISPMSSFFIAARHTLWLCLAALLAPAIIHSQSAYVPQGEEYPVAGLLRGDQVFPRLSISRSGGYLVWQDNITDGDGFGISARRLGGGMSGNLAVFRVNEQGVSDQEHPDVTLTSDGGAVFFWHGGEAGQQNVFARFMGADGVFLTGDVRVNTHTANQQRFPTIGALPNNQVVIIWSSHGQDGSLEGVFGQKFSTTGRPIGVEFRVNQYTAFNQRNPALAVLENGDFMVAWVSENQRFHQSVDIVGRRFNAGAEPLTHEFLINASTNISANPVLSARMDGGFLAGWSQIDMETPAHGWDVFIRSYNGAGQALGAPSRINTHGTGQQYAPRISSIGEAHLVVWTSEDQDGSREGVYGRFVDGGGAPLSAEFRVNTSTANRQHHPAVGSDGVNQFLVVWSSYIGLPYSFDLLGQRYAMTPLAPAAPFVSALNSSRLSVTWPLAGTNTVASYDLYINDATAPVNLVGSIYSLGNLAPGSGHSFRLAYRFANGQRSLLSAPASGTTWGADENLDGLPDDWQSRYWGDNQARWPDPREDSDGDGATNLQEFLAGTDPTNAQSVLRLETRQTEQGNFLHYNTQPGLVYQVQVKKSLATEWEDVGLPRFAVGTQDSVLLDLAGPEIYYRVKRLR
jgi:hypothetical protein